MRIETIPKNFTEINFMCLREYIVKCVIMKYNVYFIKKMYIKRRSIEVIKEF